MKKFFKIFVTALITAALACTAGIFAACGNGGDGGNGDNTPPVTDNSPKYEIAIVGSDDQPIDCSAILTQICLPSGACFPFMPGTIGADGKLVMTQTEVNNHIAKNGNTSYDQYRDEDGNFTEFVFHVLGAPGYAADCEIEIDGPKAYTFKLYTDTTPETPHECESVCPLCGKCTDETCTDPVCADKCEGHVYNLTIKLPDGSAAAGASVKIGAASIKANAEGKVTLDLINNLSYLGGAKEEYTFEITSGDYSASVTLKATQESAEGYNVTVTLE